MYQSGQKSSTNLTHERGSIALPNPEDISRSRRSHKAFRALFSLLLLTSPLFCVTFISFQADFFSPWDGKSSHCLFWYYTSLQTKIPEKRTQVSSPGASTKLGTITARHKPITEARSHWSASARRGALSGFNGYTGKLTRPILQEMLCSIMKRVMDHFSKEETLGKHEIWSFWLIPNFSLNCTCYISKSHLCSSLARERST